MSVTHLISLKAGQLEITVHRSCWPMAQLLTFGSRINPKRSFLFVSKVLGKYVPCCPARIQDSYRLLVEECLKDPQLPLSGDCFAVWGVAETATGLGAGFAHTLKNSIGGRPVFYQHTTRHQLAHSLAFSISEVHSHAPSHRVYQPAHEHQQALHQTKVAFLVDDEISTGKTLLQLAHALCDQLPHVEHIVWVSLVDWLSDASRKALQQQLNRRFPQVTLHTQQLLQGEFRFSPNGDYQPQLPPKTAQGLAQKQGGYDAPRLGYWVDAMAPDWIESQFQLPNGEALSAAQLPDLVQKTGYCVIGTGEFTYLPFLLAKQWQEQGIDVLFQSTGRSPALVDGGLSSRLDFWDDLEQGDCYLYNQCQDRHAIILYESREQMENCTLHRHLSATVAVYSGAEFNERGTTQRNKVVSPIMS